MVTPNAVDWLILVAVLAISTGLDTYLNRGRYEISSRRAWTQVAISVGIAVVFGGYIVLRFGGEAVGQYYAAYPLELSLSLDNVFAFQLILSSVAVMYRATLLTWAVMLAVVLRACFLSGGAALLESFTFVELIFGGLLLFTAVRMLRSIRSGSEETVVLEDMRTYKVMRFLLPFTDRWYGVRLVTIKAGGIKFTPATLVVVCIGCIDVIFAVDSVPAVLAVSHTPYVVLAAVMMAVICLKSLYFVYQALVEKFPRVNHVLVFVLAFIGAKLAVGYFNYFGLIDEFPTWLSLVVVLTTLLVGVVWSKIETTRTSCRQ
jgi:tellurite resistance protein TerC